VKTNVEALFSPYRRSLRQSLVRLYQKTTASDFVQKVSETFLTRILLIGIGLITSVIVARVLGPEGRGLYAVAATITAMGVQFGNLGLHASNTYYVARDKKILPALVGNTIVVSFGFGGLGCAFTWIIFSLWPKLAPVNGFLLILSLTWIPFGLAYMLLQNLLLGIQDVRTYNKIELTTKILGVGFIALVIFLRCVTVEEVFLAGLITLVIGFLWAFFRLLSKIPNLAMPSFALFKENIQYGLKAYIATFFAFLVLRSDLLIVKYMVGTEQTGYYSVAVSMAELIYILPVVVGTILFPKLTPLTDIREKWLLAKRVTFNMTVGMLLMLTLAGFLAHPIVEVLFGKAFLPSISAFLWLLPGMFFLGIETIAVQFLNSIGFPIIVVGVWVLTALLNIGLNIWVIPAYGIVGASMVSSLSYFVAFVLVLWIIRKTKVEHE
jgi:O-antigen/teichoic acid export membrane protein